MDLPRTTTVSVTIHNDVHSTGVYVLPHISSWRRGAIVHVQSCVGACKSWALLLSVGSCHDGLHPLHDMGALHLRQLKKRLRHLPIHPRSQTKLAQTVQKANGSNRQIRHTVEGVSGRFLDRETKVTPHLSAFPGTCLTCHPPTCRRWLDRAPSQCPSGASRRYAHEDYPGAGAGA